VYLHVLKFCFCLWQSASSRKKKEKERHDDERPEANDVATAKSCSLRRGVLAVLSCGGSTDICYGILKSAIIKISFLFNIDT
jgi:hypothetical protein